MQSIKQLFIHYWPTMLVLCVIFYATLFSSPLGDNELPPIPYLDKWIHAIMMGGLLGAVAFDYERSRKPARALTTKVMMMIFVGVVAFSLFDEFLQGWIDNGRNFEAADFYVDIAGAIVAYFTAPPAIYATLKVKPK